MKELFTTPLSFLCLAAAVMLACLFMAPVQAQAEALTMVSGTGNLNFDDTTGELSLTGSGKIIDYRNSETAVPWHSHRADITSVHMDATLQPSSMISWFQNCESLTSTNAGGGWDVSQVTSLYRTFRFCESLSNLDVSNWNTSLVTDMDATFDECKALTSLDVSNWNTSSVTNMYQIIDLCPSLTNLDVSRWNTSSVTDMGEVFSGCESLTSLDISNWNTSAATQINWMFVNCKALTSRDVSNWNIAAVTGLDSMFSGCSALANLDVSNWNTASVTNMYGVFDDCKALTSLDLSTWNTAAVTDMNQMFSSCGIRQVTFGPDWQFKSGYDSYFPQPNPNDDPAYTIKWQAVGTGSVDYPAGPIYSMYELMDYYNQPRHVSETYVRERSQPTATYYYVDFVDGKSVGVNDDVENLPAPLPLTRRMTSPFLTKCQHLRAYTFMGYSWNGNTVLPGDTIIKQAADTHITLTALGGRMSAAIRNQTIPQKTSNSPRRETFCPLGCL